MASDSLVSLLGEAATLMLTGMVFVFAFLALLIAGVKAIAWYCLRYPGNEDVAVSVRTPSAPVQSAVSGQTIAAITAAIHQHRNNQK